MEERLILGLLEVVFERASPLGLLLILALVGSLIVWAIYYSFREHRRPPQVGVETLRGRTAVALENLGQSGQVRLDGAVWNARAKEGIIASGEKVRVLAVEDGLVLVVEKVE